MEDFIKKDNINPDHYKKETSLECIEAMELIFGAAAVRSFCICNAWKYIWRWKNKNGGEDLHKADWYIRYVYTNKHHFPFLSEDLQELVTRMRKYVEHELCLLGGNETDEVEEPSV